jgi:hypothetical protein
MYQTVQPTVANTLIVNVEPSGDSGSEDSPNLRPDLEDGRNCPRYPRRGGVDYFRC